MSRVTVFRGPSGKLHMCKPRRPHPEVDAIVATICAKHGVTPDEVFGSCRDGIVVKARHEAMLLARDIAVLNHSDIARAFGKDHATVRYALRKAAG